MIERTATNSRTPKRSQAGRFAWRVIALAATPLMAATTSARGQLPCHYDVTVLPGHSCGTFGGPGNPVAINNLGHVLLTAPNCGEPAYDETYLWTGGPTLTLIQRPAGMVGFQGNDINDNDVVCGTAVFAGSSAFRAVIYDHGNWTILPPLNPPLGWSSAEAVNNSGQVCGYRSIGSKTDPLVPQQAFVWSPATGFADLGVMNGPNSQATDLADDGTVVGWTGSSIISNGTRAFVHRNGITTILPAIPNGSTSAALAVLTASRVAVYGLTVVNSVTVPRGFAYFDNNPIPLGVLPGFIRTFPIAIDNHGEVFGYCTSASLQAQAFVWRDGAITNLNTLIATPGASMIEPWDATGDGRIVGQGATTNGNATIVLTPAFSIAGDTNCDTRVNVDDLLNVIVYWGSCYGCSADTDGNERVDVWDLVYVLLHWGG